MILINKDNPLPEDWEENIAPYMITVPNPVPNDTPETFMLEKSTYEAFEALRKSLLEEDMIDIELDSCTRTVAEQKALAKRFTEEFGEDYVKKYVAVPGYSEHHTGLVIDSCIILDGKQIDDNDEMLAQTEINAKVWTKLADYGFILRYPQGKEDIT